MKFNKNRKVGKITKMKKGLILVISDKMDSNRKSDRHEDKLIRIGESARENLGLTNDKSVELWPEGSSTDRINRSKLLKIFKAYSSDLKKLKQPHMGGDEYLRVGFVTTKTFNYICGNQKSKKSQKDIWISDTIEDTVLGADPEFVLMAPDNSIQYAGHVVGFSFEGELGSDGPWAEIRPEPTIDVTDFVHNIRKIFKSHPKTEAIKQYDWMSGCFYNNKDSRYDENKNWPIGGHIHIGIPAMLYKLLEEEDNYKGSTYACLAKTVDEYITIPMMRIENVDKSVKRRREYGKFGDFKSDHPGRIECRTLSGEWMTHPELTKAVIGSVKAVSRSFFKILEENGFEKDIIVNKKMQSQGYRALFSTGSSNSNAWKDIKAMQAMKTIRSSKEMSNILQKGQIKFDQNYFNKLKAMFKSLSTYNDHSEYIDRFLDIVKLSKSDLNKIDHNLKHTWIGDKKFVV